MAELFRPQGSVYKSAVIAATPQINGAQSHEPRCLQRNLYSYVSNSLGDIEDYVVRLESENARLKYKMISTIRPALVCLFASQDGLAVSAALGAWKRVWEESKIQQLEEYWATFQRQSRQDYAQKIETLEERLEDQKSKRKALQEQIEQASNYVQELEAERDSMAEKGANLKSQIAEADKCVKVLSQETESALDIVRNDFRKYERIMQKSSEEDMDAEEQSSVVAGGPRRELANIKDKLDKLVSRVAASPSLPSTQLARPPPPSSPPLPGSDHDSTSALGGSFQTNHTNGTPQQRQRQPSPLVRPRSLQNAAQSIGGPPTDHLYPLELPTGPGSMVVDSQGMFQVPPQQSPEQIFQGSMRLTPAPVASMGPSPLPSPMPYPGQAFPSLVENRQVSGPVPMLRIPSL